MASWRAKQSGHSAPFGQSILGSAASEPCADSFYGQTQPLARTFKKHKILGIAALVAAVLLVGTGRYVGITYRKAVSALESEQFSKAQQYFDAIPAGHLLFAEQYAYARANALLEQRDYAQALIFFRKLDEELVSQELIDSILPTAYVRGRRLTEREIWTRPNKFLKRQGIIGAARTTCS